MGSLSTAVALLRSYNELLLERPSPGRVRRVLLAVNNWCNGRCAICGIWRNDKDQALAEELTVDEWQVYVLDAQSLDAVRDVGITGGEPFLRRDLVALCGAIYRRWPQVHLGLVTNGLLPTRIADLAVEIATQNREGALSILVSLDGHGASHDALRGVAGSFERALETVELLKSRVPSAVLGLSHTMVPANVADALRCYELSRELGVGFMYRLAHGSTYLSNDEASFWTIEALEAARPVVQELNHRLLRDQGLLARLGNMHYASHAFYAGMLGYHRCPGRESGCYSGTHSLFLNHQGDLFPCINLARSMGNVRQGGLDQVWRSPEASRVRAFIAARRCHCWTNCETELTLARQPRAFLQGMAANLTSLLPERDGSEPPGR